MILTWDISAYYMICRSFILTSKDLNYQNNLFDPAQKSKKWLMRAFCPVKPKSQSYVLKKFQAGAYEVHVTIVWSVQRAGHVSWPLCSVFYLSPTRKLLLKRQERVQRTTRPLYFGVQEHLSYSVFRQIWWDYKHSAIGVEFSNICKKARSCPWFKCHGNLSKNMIWK